MIGGSQPRASAMCSGSRPHSSKASTAALCALMSSLITPGERRDSRASTRGVLPLLGEGCPAARW